MIGAGSSMSSTAKTGEHSRSSTLVRPMCWRSRYLNRASYTALPLDDAMLRGAAFERKKSSCTRSPSPKPRGFISVQSSGLSSATLRQWVHTCEAVNRRPSGKAAKTPAKTSAGSRLIFKVSLNPWAARASARRVISMICRATSSAGLSKVQHARSPWRGRRPIAQES